MQVLDTRRNEIMEEVLDLLMSFVDFQAFKELMLAHKSESVTSAIHVRALGVPFVFHSLMPTQNLIHDQPWLAEHLSCKHVTYACAVSVPSGMQKWLQYNGHPNSPCRDTQK